MKEVPKKDLPEVSGGFVVDGTCIPDPPFIGEPAFPPRPGGPYVDLPYPYVDPSEQT